MFTHPTNNLDQETKIASNVYFQLGNRFERLSCVERFIRVCRKRIDDV